MRGQALRGAVDEVLGGHDPLGREEGVEALPLVGGALGVQGREHRAQAFDDVASGVGSGPQDDLQELANGQNRDRRTFGNQVNHRVIDHQERDNLPGHKWIETNIPKNIAEDLIDGTAEGLPARRLDAQLARLRVVPGTAEALAGQLEIFADGAGRLLPTAALAEAAERCGRWLADDEASGLSFAEVYARGRGGGRRR